MLPNLPDLPAGRYLVLAAEQLIIDLLRSSREGLTNAEISRAAGLDVEVKSQRSYISWTLLQDMVRKGLVIREDQRYRLP